MPRNLSPLLWMSLYSVRPDSEERGYHQWLRDLDNPFFNSRPGIVRYENWQVASVPVGTVPFDYFDLFFVDETLGPDGHVPFEGEQEAAFARGWNDLWGLAPDGYLEESGANIIRCRLVAEPEDVVRTGHVVLIGTTPRAGAQDDGYDDWLRTVDNPFLNSLPEITSYTNWRVEHAHLGPTRFTDFDLMHVPDADGWERMVGNDAMREFAEGWIRQWGPVPDGSFEDNFVVVVGELIAAPGFAP